MQAQTKPSRLKIILVKAMQGLDNDDEKNIPSRHPQFVGI
jgi:hypothetical protein